MFFCASGSATLGVIVVILVVGVLVYFMKAALERDTDMGIKAIAFLLGILLLVGLIVGLVKK